jgi:hypothetical protein
MLIIIIALIIVPNVCLNVLQLAREAIGWTHALTITLLRNVRASTAPADRLSRKYAIIASCLNPIMSVSTCVNLSSALCKENSRVAHQTNEADALWLMTFLILQRDVSFNHSMAGHCTLHHLLYNDCAFLNKHFWDIVFSIKRLKWN